MVKGSCLVRFCMTAAPRPAQLDKIVQRFARISEPKRRYEQLLWYAKKLAAFPAEDKIPENKVSGCVSQVYITAQVDSNDKISFQGDSDAQITKGLLAMLITALNGLSPSEIVRLTPDFIKETQLDVSLTPSRANGFYNIFKMMQKKALLLMGSDADSRTAS
ncbi:MAG: SufE family protein [Phormidesmis sp.]